MSAEFGQRRGGAQHEDAAVPEIAVGDEARRRGGVRLLDEARDRAAGQSGKRRAGMNVAVAGRRVGGPQAEDDDVARLGRRQRGADRRPEAGDIADDVIGGKNEENGVGVGFGGERGGRGNGRGGIAPLRLEQDRGAGVRVRQCGADKVGVTGAGHDNRRREGGGFGDARQRQGEGRDAVDQRQERLRRVLARDRPQTQARTTAKNDRRDHVIPRSTDLCRAAALPGG